MDRKRSTEIAELYRKYAPIVYRLCYHFAKDRQTALDLRQDVFLKIIKGYEKFRGDSSLSTWVHSVTNHHCLDYVRTRKRRDLCACEGWVNYQSEPAQKSDESLIYSRLDLLPLLKLCLPTTRLMIQLFYMEGYSHDEIAGILGLSRVAVTRRIQSFTQKALNYSPALGKSIS